MPVKPDDEDYLTPKEIAGRLHVSQSSAYNIIRRAMRHQSIGKPGSRKATLRVPVSAYEEFIAKSEVVPEKTRSTPTPPPPSLTKMPPGVKNWVK